MIWPTLNAVLNLSSAILLFLGWRGIRGGRIRRHRALMLAAFSVSVAFLVSYLLYHAHAGSRPFPGHGWIRAVYFVILISHSILAAVVAPLVLVTLARGLRGNFAKHRALARWTFPVWLYVSVTGVVVYVMLYQITWR